MLHSVTKAQLIQKTKAIGNFEVNQILRPKLTFGYYLLRPPHLWIDGSVLAFYSWEVMSTVVGNPHERHTRIRK